MKRKERSGGCHYAESECGLLLLCAAPTLSCTNAVVPFGHEEERERKKTTRKKKKRKEKEKKKRCRRRRRRRRKGEKKEANEKLTSIRDLARTAN